MATIINYALTATSASFATTASYVLGGGGGSGSTTPGGPNDSIQFNKNGAFTGSSFLTYSESISGNYLSYTGSLKQNGNYEINGSVSSSYFIGNSTVINPLTASYAMTASYIQGLPNNLTTGTGSYGTKVYYTTVTSQVPSLNNGVENEYLFATPLEIRRPKTLQEIVARISSNQGVGVTATGSVRLGIYNDNGNMYPGTKLYDSGELNVSGSDGIQILFISGSNSNLSLSPGMIWLTCITSGSFIGGQGWLNMDSVSIQNDPTPTLGYILDPISPEPFPIPRSCLFVSSSVSVSGSLPSTFPLNPSLVNPPNASSYPIVYVHFSA